MKKNNRGFSLMGLVLVLATICIVTLVVVFSVSENAKQAKVEEAVAKAHVNVLDGSKEEVVQLALGEVRKIEINLATPTSNDRFRHERNVSIETLKMYARHLAKEDAANAEFIKVKLERLFSYGGQVNYGVKEEVVLPQIRDALKEILEG
jgi:Tfp pilus assembly protein FimT